MRLPVSKGVPITQNYKGILHNGIDYSGRFDTYVYAPEAGRVYHQKQTVGGNVIRLITKTGEHRLAHLSKYLVYNGATVKEGQKIGVMGNTGWSTARHLHWGLLAGGKYVNPATGLRQYKWVRYHEGAKDLAKRAGWPDWDKEARWTHIAKLNGYSTWRAFNKGIKLGQRVRVR